MLSFVASGRYTISSDRYPPHVLHRSCTELMDLDIIRLKKEHCGGGAVQYKHNDAITNGSKMDNLPLAIYQALEGPEGRSTRQIALSRASPSDGGALGPQTGRPQLTFLTAI